MPAYAVAHLRNVNMGPSIEEYLQRIDATLEPFAGRFLIHGGELEVLEGTWPGHLIVIEFPDRARAHAWYQSTAYQQILPLRSQQLRGGQRTSLPDRVVPPHPVSGLPKPSVLICEICGFLSSGA